MRDRCSSTLGALGAPSSPVARRLAARQRGRQLSQ
jgi:hypothetical protein